MMSALGHERRPMQLATAPQLPLCPASDRGVAAQYVVEGQQRILLACLHQGNSIFPRALNSAGRRLS
jgi:hypothetical protein